MNIAEIVGIIAGITGIFVYSWANARRLGKVEQKASDVEKQMVTICSSMGDIDNLRIELANVSTSLTFFHRELERGHDRFDNISKDMVATVKTIHACAERLAALERDVKNVVKRANNRGK